MHLPGREARVCQATSYRYLHEALQVITDRAPELSKVPAQEWEKGWTHVCLDGYSALIETTGSSARSDTGHDLWYSGKHKTRREHSGAHRPLRVPGVDQPGPARLGP